MDNYHQVREYTGSIREGDKRYVDLIGEYVHVDNDVRVYEAWRHNVKDVLVLPLLIEQKGGPDINSVYIVRLEDESPVESVEVTFGWKKDYDKIMKKRDVLREAENLMDRYPDAEFDELNV